MYRLIVIDKVSHSPCLINLAPDKTVMVAGNGSYACTQQQGFPSTKDNLVAVTNKCPNKKLFQTKPFTSQGIDPVTIFILER